MTKIETAPGGKGQGKSTKKVRGQFNSVPTGDLDECKHKIDKPC